MMRSKKLFWAALALALSLLLSACMNEDFESNAITLRGASSLELITGKSLALTVEVNEKYQGATLLTKTDSDALVVDITGSTMTLSGNEPGDYVLTLTLDNKGYNPRDFQYAVRVAERDIELSAKYDGGDLAKTKKGVQLNNGESGEIALSSAAKAAVYTAKSSNERVAKVILSENAVTIESVGAGEAQITITAADDRFSTSTLKIPVSVAMTAAKLTVNNTTAYAAVGQNAVISCTEIQDGGSISAICESSAVSVSVSGSSVYITSGTAGSYEVKIICAADGFTDNVQTVTAVFSLTPLNFTATASANTFAVTGFSSITMSGYPNGTVFTASATNGLKAAVNGNVITVTGASATSGNVTITGSCQGYSSSSVSIPMTVVTKTKADGTYADYINDIIALINKERAKNSLAPLSYDARLESACATRAKEAAALWSHTRPDGRQWNTVFNDYSISGLYTGKGENLLNSYTLDAESAVEAWMGSTDHRENILRTEYTATCIAIYKTGANNYYFAQLFVR